MNNILILKFPYSSLFGGGEKHTMTLVEKLNPKDFKFYLASSCTVLLKEFQYKKLDFEYVKAPTEPVSKKAILLFILKAPFFKLKLKKIVKKYKSEKNITTIYCLSLTEKILITKFAKKIGLKVVWMEHVSMERWLSKNPLKILYKKYSKDATIVSASKSISQELLKLGINGENIKTIYFGVKQENTPYERSAELNNKFIIGTIGRLTKEKGVNVLIEAFKKVSEVIPNSELQIIGDGPDKKYLEHLTEKLGLNDKIKFLGFQRNTSQYYQNFNIFILPSLKRESFGIVLIEALKFQLPIIASNIGGIPEIITNDQEGLLFEPGNIQDLTSKIIWTRQNYQEMIYLATHGQNKVRQLFNLDKTISEFSKVFSHEVSK